MSREPRTQKQADRQAYRKHAKGSAPKLRGPPLFDTEGRRWQAYENDPYFFPPPAPPLVLYACYFGKARTAGKEVDPPEVGREVEFEGGGVFHLERERSSRRAYRVFEVRILSINDSEIPPQ